MNCLLRWAPTAISCFEKISVEVDMIGRESGNLRIPGIRRTRMVSLLQINTHKIIAVVIIFLASNTYFDLVMTSLSCGFKEVLRE